MLIYLRRKGGGVYWSCFSHPRSKEVGIVTSHVRSTTGGYVFTGVRLFRGSTCLPAVKEWGVPTFQLKRGTYLSANKGGPTLALAGGYLPWPCPGVPPIQGRYRLARVGTPPPPAKGRYPLAKVGTPHQGGCQSSTASTCYAAGIMPLAFMQEDFLVILCTNIVINKRNGPHSNFRKIGKWWFVFEFCDLYRPHPKDDGRLCFHKNLSVNTPGVYPIWLMGVPHPS